MVCSLKLPKAPSQSVRMPSLMVPDCVEEPPLVLLLLLLRPHPAATSIRTVSVATRRPTQIGRHLRLELLPAMDMLGPSPLCGPSLGSLTAAVSGCFSCGAAEHGGPAPQERFPDAEQAAWRGDHDQQEDQPDDGVKTVAERGDVADVVVHGDEHQRAEEGAGKLGDAADHRDHDECEGGAEPDRGGVDVAIPPDEHDPGDGGDHA